MAQSIEFIKDRATKTISAAKAVALVWKWQEQTIPQLQAGLTAIIGDDKATPPALGQEKITSAAEKEMTNARAAWDSSLDNLHRLTMQGISMAKNHFRDDDIKMSLVQDLTARGDSRAGILDEALEWETAWNKVDPAWNPLPANTLPLFNALRLQCLEGLQSDYKDKLSTWREQAGLLAQLARTLEDTNEAWYSDAEDVFPAGTAEGDMIRGTIPTTYNPPAPKPPTPAVTPKPATP
jgi:hypothetical protein